MNERLTGLVAATFTPMHDDGALNLDMVGPMVDHLLKWNIGGVYVVGSTGEGVSLSCREREEVADAFVRAVDGRIPVVIQVGHNSLDEARRLAAHAEKIGASAISAVPPGYFKIDSAETLAACMANIAAGAPATPFYYYHVPHLSGAALSVVDFLRIASDRIPTLAGVKYTAPTLHEMQACMDFNGGQYEVLHGVDEMLLAGLAVGAKSAIGSTYNYASPMYHHVMRAFSEGDLVAARLWQARAIEMIRTFLKYRGLAGQKAIMQLIGIDCGPTRLPIPALTAEEIALLRDELSAIGYFEWIK